MKHKTLRLKWFLTGLVLFGGLLPAILPLNLLPKTAANGKLSVESVVAKLVEQNRLRDSRLQKSSFTTTRAYRVKDSKGNLRAEAKVAMQQRAPGTKEFKVLSQSGSSFVHGRVIKPLMESEAEAAGRQREESAITPANYTFELLGEEGAEGHHCYLVQATPKRTDKFLFKGKIWIHATEFAIVKIAGQPVKNPSFMIKRVDFVRRYQKVGEFWFPFKDESVTQVRLAGTNVLTVDYDNGGVAQLVAKR
jgi:hypothetical protein